VLIVEQLALPGDIAELIGGKLSFKCMMAELLPNWRRIPLPFNIW
jgi:hypothetical protein